MRTNRGLVHAVREPREGQLILVQAKDAEGFFCNVAEPPTVKRAVALAEDWAREECCETRVCVGPKRDVVRVFGGDGL